VMFSLVLFYMVFFLFSMSLCVDDTLVNFASIIYFFFQCVLSFSSPYFVLFFTLFFGLNSSLAFHIYVYLFFDDTFTLMDSTFAHFFMLLFSISFPSCIHFYDLRLLHSFVPNFFPYISFLFYSSCFHLFLFVFLFVSCV